MKDCKKDLVSQNILMILQQKITENIHLTLYQKKIMPKQIKLKDKKVI